MIKLVVGLGNPGKEYAKTRHNAGFIVIDEIAGNGFKKNSKYSTEEKKIGRGALYVKPLTFMNHSGRSVIKYKNFYKLQPGEILIIHDDVDLPIGATRVRLGGSSSHKGIESVAKAIKSEDFWRVRIGIGKPKNTKALDTVLKNLTSIEVSKIKNLAREIKKFIRNPEETTIKI